MLKKHLYCNWTAAIGRDRRQIVLWFCLSLAVAGGFGIYSLQQAFSSEYVVQDDARQQLVWMGRLVEPDLMPNDFIANYFQSVAPWGFARLYQGFAAIGIDPLLLSKLLPLLLALGTTAYCFALSFQVLPLPAIAAVSTLLFNQNFWMRDDLASASPRAFLNLLFLAFLYYLLRESLLPCLVAIGLLGLVYPQYVLVAAGILLLRLVPRRKESRSWRSIKFCLAGLAVACLVLLPFALTSAQFGPVITVTEARTLPEFAAGGRARFFFADLGRYWLTAGRSGIQLPLDPPLLGLALLLPVLSRFPTRFPLVQQTRQLGVLVQLTIAALLLFFAAHALLFKLHLPSRYTQHSLRIVMAIGAAIALAILLDALWRSANDRQIYHRLVAIGLTGLTIAFLLLYPFSLGNFPRTTYLKGSAAPLYEFFAQQPKSSLIASLSEEANQVPIFARRSIFVGSEYAIPYHVGYYRIFRQRVLDLIQAQYSPNRKVVQAFIQQQEIDFWLLDRAAFTTDYLAQNSWLRQYQPAHQKALATLQHNTIPALQTLMPRCTAFEMPAFVVLDTACITAASVGMPRP